MVTNEKATYYKLMELRQNREKKKAAKSIRKKRLRIASVIALIISVTVVFGVMYNAFAMDITITEINEFTGLNESQTVRTKGGSVEAVLEEHGLSLSDEDRLNVPADKEVADKDDIVITRGKRVTIKVGDHEDVATVTKADLHDALVEAGYVPGEYDDITSDGDTIHLVSVSQTDEVISEAIERGVEYVDDPDLPKGQEVVMDEGEDGVKEVSQKVKYVNGEESERQTLGENIAAEPRSKVIARGTLEVTPPPAISSKSGSSSGSGTSSNTVSESAGTINGHSYKKKITMTATAYSTDPSENAGYTVSAMGNPLGYGIVAIDPNVVPLGSTVYVTAPDGSWVYGVASAEDTGGAIKGNRIDLCFPYNADDFGRRSCVVYILD